MSSTNRLQELQDLEKWYENNDDPWNYETTPDDKKRIDILLSEIPDKQYKRVLDIGCGNGFVTKKLPGQFILGTDISEGAIRAAKKIETDNLKFEKASLFGLDKQLEGQFDLIVITGVLYPQYIGNAHVTVYETIDRLLAKGGILVSVHIDEWYKAQFPYLKLNEIFYPYRDYNHRLEIYVK